MALEENTPPVAMDDSGSTGEDTSLIVTLGTNDLLQNDSDADGDMLTVNTVPVVSPANGVLNLNSNGTYTYIPNTNFNGNDTFVYEVSDGNGGTDMGTVNIIVVPINDAPVFESISDITVYDGDVINFTITANDPDADPLAYSSTTLPDGATLNTQTGIFNWIAKREKGKNGGTFNIAFEVSDSELVDSQTMTIFVEKTSGGGKPKKGK
ncbi:MAG: cadherin-like domain-containing protein [Proteobacteria bacterium]|nr:cadherin-like domain-containing protein [Pseudomonadota bacterium]